MRNADPQVGDIWEWFQGEKYIRYLVLETPSDRTQPLGYKLLIVSENIGKARYVNQTDLFSHAGFCGVNMRLVSRAEVP